MKTFEDEHRTTVTVGPVTVTVIDRSEIESFHWASGWFLTARREPRAVIVEERKGEAISRRRIPLDG